MEKIKIAEAGSGLRFLYKTCLGRGILKILTNRSVSEWCGRYLDSTHSKWLIEPFLQSNHINMSDYQNETYTCFNDCFCRRIKPELRPVDMNPDHMIAPCDGLMSVYRIQDGLVLPVKQSQYSIERLLRDKKLARKYQEGYCFVFRLCVDHYHRYAYCESGHKTSNRFIPGVLHTVRPIALECEPVFTENAREYTMIRTEQFGDVIQMEVGAMLVGKIHNEHQKCSVKRGQEKGHFLYGGSTVIMLVEAGQIDVSEDYLKATKDHEEISIKLGQCIATHI